MPSQGPFFPTAAADSGIGAEVWSNPSRIEATDGSYATVSFPISGFNLPSDDLQGTGFGFNIPSNATINGIIVVIVRHAGFTTVSDADVTLLKAGTATGNNKAAGGTWNQSPDQSITYGSSIDLWGTTWTPSDINNANFGVQMSCNGGNALESDVALVDSYTIQVFYTINSQNLTGAITLGVTAGFSDASVETGAGTISLGVTAGFSDARTFSTAPQNVSLGVIGGFITGPGPVSGLTHSITAGFSPAASVQTSGAITLGVLAGFADKVFKNVIFPPFTPPPKPPQIDPSQYTNLITNFHNQRPKFMASVQALVQASVDLQNQLSYLFVLLDINFAVGDQLDKIGQWIGVSRQLPTPLSGVFFSWGILGLGWGQGVWFGSGGLPADGTLIQTSGGSLANKYQLVLGSSSIGQAYQYSVAINNTGPTLQVSDGQGNVVVIAPGVQKEVFIQSTGNGSPLTLSFQGLNPSDSLNFVVASPSINIPNGPNLIPAASLQFQGAWAAVSGAVVIVTQNQIDPLQPISLTSLPDDKYRTLLRARIAFNSWDGTIPGIYNIWTIVFATENFQLAIVDNQNMTMTVLIVTNDAIDQVTLALITGGFIVPRPAGVLITAYQQIQAPLFGWGLETSFVQGWGQGNWI